MAIVFTVISRIIYINLMILRGKDRALELSAKVDQICHM